MQHFSFTCPGLHGPDSRTDLQKLTYGDLFEKFRRITIPIMQRRYCWEGVLLDRWWACTILGAGRTEDGSHRTGLVVFRRQETPPNSVLVIDGQQRLTTNLLLCASIRDALWRCGTSSRAVAAAASVLHRAIVVGEVDSQTLSAHVSRLAEGGVLECSRLAPSFPDRLPYYRLICENGASLVGDSDEAASFLLRARKHFDREAASLSGAQLVQAATRTLKSMTLMSMEVLTEKLDVCQVFLWLQERSLLTMGALLLNLTPGIRFEATDLTRNLFLSNYVALAPEEQERIYRAHWLPLEKLFSSPAEFSRCLERYTTARLPPTAPPSELEQHVAAAGTFLKSKGVTSIDVTGALLYTKFLRLYNLVVEAVPCQKEEPPPEPPKIRKVSPLALLDDLAAFARDEKQH